MTSSMRLSKCLNRLEKNSNRSLSNKKILNCWNLKNRWLQQKIRHSEKSMKKIIQNVAQKDKEKDNIREIFKRHARSGEHVLLTSRTL